MLNPYQFPPCILLIEKSIAQRIGSEYYFGALISLPSLQGEQKGVRQNNPAGRNVEGEEYVTAALHEFEMAIVNVFVVMSCSF